VIPQNKFLSPFLGMKAKADDSNFIFFLDKGLFIHG